PLPDRRPGRSRRDRRDRPHLPPPGWWDSPPEPDGCLPTTRQATRSSCPRPPPVTVPHRGKCRTTPGGRRRRRRAVSSRFLRGHDGQGTGHAVSFGVAVERAEEKVGSGLVEGEGGGVALHLGQRAENV